MATIREILNEKGPQVFTVRPDMTVLDAAREMNRNKIGSLVVVDDDRVVGIFTERDVLRRVVAECRDPKVVRLGEIMTTEVAVCRQTTTIDEARAVMRNRRIRHLPVVDEEHRLLGLISIGDLNAWRLNGQEETIHFLREYLYGHT